MKVARLICVCLAVALLAGGSEVLAQCPTTVTGTSPSIFGKAVTPPSARLTLADPIADGIVFAVDTAGYNRIYEIDFDGVWDANNVRLPVTSLVADTAGLEIEAAINADAGAHWTAMYAYGVAGANQHWLVLTWEDTTHYGALVNVINSQSSKLTRNTNFSANTATPMVITPEVDNSPAYLKIQGTGLTAAATGLSVQAVHSSGSPTINGTIAYREADGSYMTVQLKLYQTATVNPPLGMYNVIVNNSACTPTTVATLTNAFELVENMLDDPSFRVHFSGWSNALQWNGSPDVGLSPFWKKATAFTSTDVIRNGSACLLGKPRGFPFKTGSTTNGDNEDGSISFNAGDGLHRMWQVVDVSMSNPTALTLSGAWWGCTDGAVSVPYGIQLRAGDGPDAGVAPIAETPPAEFVTWLGESFFSLTGNFPQGTTKVTVVFWVSSNNYQNKGLHFDDLLLRVDTTCTQPPVISTITPDYGVRGTTQGINLSGNFVAGATSVVLKRSGYPDINPTGTPTSTATTVSATFDLTGAALGFYDLMVTVPGCTSLTVGQAFNVILAGPSLTNGGFELPTAAGGCPPTEMLNSVPTDWTPRQFDNYGTGPTMHRDVTSLFAPTCPPPEGQHYAGIYSNLGGGTLQLSQTVTITSGRTYSLSGFFAGTGSNEGKMRLIDGPATGSNMAGGETQVLATGGPHDWTLKYVTGTATQSMATAAWETRNTANGDKRSYADGLVLEECTGPVSVTGITPAEMGGGTVVSNATVTGSGFTGSPKVYLVRMGRTYEATGITVTNNTMLTCSFNITAQEPIADFDVVVKNNGCFGKLAAAVKIGPTQIVNGDFEEPYAELHCNLPGGPPTTVTTAVDAWLSDVLPGGTSGPLSLRDGNLHYPVTCPCPFGYGGHYASMQTDNAGERKRTWQTLKTSAYGRYTFRGYFAGGGVAQVRIKIVNGQTPDGTMIATQDVNTPGEAYQWPTVETGYKEVSAFAQSAWTTFVWEIEDQQSLCGACATHADVLTVIPGAMCHSPWADTDEDTDVDQDDFGFLQRCITIGNLANGLTGLDSYCRCLDRVGDVPDSDPDGQIKDMDVQKFIDCADGPGVTATCP